jgi:hypothetical protein
MSVGDTCYYCIQNPTVGEWEIGVGTYSSANTLTRTTVISSSNAGSTVTFSAGSKDVFITLAASKSPQVNPSGSITAAGASYTRTTATATGGQTSFTAAYTVNYVQVYVNGILLNSADYTATSGTAVVLSVGSTAGDIVDVVAINVGPFSGGVTITGTPSSGQLTAWTGSASVQGFAPAAVGDVPFSTDGSTFASTQKIVRGTSVATTSGTSVDFTGIPSWVKRVTVMLNGVSLSGTSHYLFQLGTGGVPTTTGYISGSSSLGAGIASITSTSGIPLYSGTAAFLESGSIVFNNLSSNIWTANGLTGVSGGTGTTTCAGGVTLGGVLNMVRITTVNGTDTFDAGSVNILYE